jgi:hypothetical protein
VRLWQERSEPLFRWAFEGCHVTRDIPSLIGKGGFKIEQMDAGVPHSISKVGVLLLVGHGGVRFRVSGPLTLRYAEITGFRRRWISGPRPCAGEARGLRTFASNETD